MVACQTEISGTRLVTHASRVTAPRYKNRVSGHRRSDKIVLEIVPRRCGWYLSQSTVVQVALAAQRSTQSMVLENSNLLSLLQSMGDK